MSKPFSARNVVASLLLGTIPPRLSSRRLVALAEAFGIAEGTTRVALTRMVERGELINRAGIYELTGTLRERQDRQEASFAPLTRSWNGDWELFVITRGARHSSDRAALRKAFGHLHIAELRDGVWIRPNNLDPARLPSVQRLLAAQVDRWVGRPSVASQVVVGDLFETDSWANAARGLIDSMTSTEHSLEVNDHTALGRVLCYRQKWFATWSPTQGCRSNFYPVIGQARNFATVTVPTTRPIEPCSPTSSPPDERLRRRHLRSS